MKQPLSKAVHREIQKAARKDVHQGKSPKSPVSTWDKLTTYSTEGKRKNAATENTYNKTYEATRKRAEELREIRNKLKR